MYSILEELRAELGSLETFVLSITPVNAALATHPDASVRQYLTLRRQYDYAAFVVALYASFERFSETLVAEYARQISSFIPYSQLPEALTKKHLTQSAEMLSRKRLGEGRFSNITSIKVAESLFQCLSGASSYSLTTEAIVSHDTNLRFYDVGKLLADVGISEFCQNLHNIDLVWNWFCNTELNDDGDQKDIKRDPEMIRALKTIFETRLNDLVERRNEVAHRGGNADELLGQTEMLARVKLIRVLAEAMFEAAGSAYLRLRASDRSYASQVEIMEGPYKGGTVIVIRSPNVPISIGQSSFEIGPDGQAKWGSVVGLKVNDEPATAIDPELNQNSIGIELDFRCGRRPQVWITHAPDPTIWAPIDRI